MAKFAINRNRKSTASTISPEVTRAVANSSPLVYNFCTRITDLHYNKVQSEMSDDEQKIQNIFSKWANDETTKRLAQLTEALTGFNPKMNSQWKLGELFKHNSSVWAVVYTDSNYVYGINSMATAYTSISSLTSKSTITDTEAGLFNKGMIEVKGVNLISYLTSIGSTVFAAFIKEFGSDLL